MASSLYKYLDAFYLINTSIFVVGLYYITHFINLEIQDQFLFEILILLIIMFSNLYLREEEPPLMKLSIKDFIIRSSVCMILYWIIEAYFYIVIGTSCTKMRLNISFLFIAFSFLLVTTYYSYHWKSCDSNNRFIDPFIGGCVNTSATSELLQDLNVYLDKTYLLNIKNKVLKEIKKNPDITQNEINDNLYFELETQISWAKQMKDRQETYLNELSFSKEEDSTTVTEKNNNDPIKKRNIRSRVKKIT